MSKAAVLTWMVWWFSLSSLCQNTDPVKMLTSPLQQFHLSADSTNALIRKVSVSNLKDVDINDIPGTVILISHDDIAMSGARDIMELLATIPGFSFGMDVDNAIGLGIRGMWAHEGKFLIMINGLPLNELDFGTYIFGQRFPLDNVDHIEIIKGPGSVIYGGTAELGVINVITAQASAKDATYINYKFGQSGPHVSKSEISFNGNHYLGNETSISFYGTMNQGIRSGYNGPDANGKTVDYADSSGIHNNEISFLLKRKNTALQYFYNNYSAQVFDAPYNIVVQLQALDFKQDVKINSKQYLSFRTNYSYQIPWSYNNITDPSRLASNTQASKLFATVNWNANLTKHLETVLGISAYRQKEIAHDVSQFPRLHLSDYAKANPGWITGISFFGDAIYRTRWFNINAGVRSEINNHVPWQITPRFGVTKQWGKVSIKIAQTSAYKIPTLQNIVLGPTTETLQTEVNSTSEIGVTVSPKSWISFSSQIFRTLIDHPIVYISDSIVFDSYVNRASIGTQGIEFNADIKRKKWSAKVAFFSYQKANKFSQLQEVQISGYKGLQGMPTQQFNLTLNYRFSDQWSVGYVLNQQHGLSAMIADIDGNMVRKDFADVYLMRLFVSAQLLKEKTLHVQVGINNLLNQHYFLTSAYTSDVAPYPIGQREVMMTLRYLISK